MALRILLADSDVTVQRMGEKILSAADHQVLAVSNGLAAIKKIPDFKPNLLLLDIHLAGYSGAELCEKVKAAPETADIIVLLTVSKLEPLREAESVKGKADGVITKPFEAGGLVATVERLSERIAPKQAVTKAAEKPPAEVVKSAPQTPLEARQRSAEERWAELRAFRARKSGAAAMSDSPGQQDSGEVCDVCGHQNKKDVTVCQNCDVPLPSSVKAANGSQEHSREG